MVVGWDYNGIMENKMEATIMENQMENEMETGRQCYYGCVV